MKEKEYEKYVEKKLYKEFEKMCKINSLDFYSCGCILTAHLVLDYLMRHIDTGGVMEEKATPKEAWDDAMKQTDYHSGYSAAFTASIIARYSPRGEEFKKWCIKDNVVMVNWK